MPLDNEGPDLVSVIWFDDLRREDVALVGGKNSSLGEMVQELGQKGIAVPPGYATTADAFRAYIEANDLGDFIAAKVAELKDHKITLAEAGRSIREAIAKGEFPAGIREAIVEAYHGLARRMGTDEVAVAVRSSATAEDLPDASFAGQQ